MSKEEEYEFEFEQEQAELQAEASENLLNNLFSSRNYFGLPGNDYGLVDKQESAVGLQEKNLKTDLPDTTIRIHQIHIDSRDCIGELSLREGQRAFAFEAATAGKIPISRFKLALRSDNLLDPDKLVNIVDQLDRDGLIKGFPRIKEENSIIRGNQLKVNLRKVIKTIKSLDVINLSIPRDIIPLYVYFPGFISNCLPTQLPNDSIQYLNPNASSPSSTWESPVLETPNDFFDTLEGLQGSITQNKLSGVFQTPLRYWRAYTGPNSMPNPYTPPPYQLWNPPQDFNNNDPWPFQPTPLRGQRIPTYRARNGIVFAGYGLYDLEDFPVTQQLQINDGTIVQIPIRKLILKLIVPKGQYINNIAVEELIDLSKDNDFNSIGIVNNPLIETGYGDYQRFLPGPGLGMTYQPNQWRENKAAPIDLSCSTYDPDNGFLGPMPVPFPTFRGNVWGPYGRPGDRFQNASLQATVDELYLNGDLDNLEGNSILYEQYDPVISEYTYEDYLLSLRRPRSIVRFRNFETAENLNIKNAMRVQYDGGFGAISCYVSNNASIRGGNGLLFFQGLPNTQYDGQFHKFNSQIWIQAREDNPENWIQTLSGPQKPTIVQDSTIQFDGWIYIWRDNFPWKGQIYVPITAGGVGPMTYYDCDQTNPEWQITDSISMNTINLSKGSSQWSASPVIGQSSTYRLPQNNQTNFEVVANLGWGKVLSLTIINPGLNYQTDVNVRTAITGGTSSTGGGLTIDILTVTPITNEINTFIINDPGNGYAIGDIVQIFQRGSNNSATFQIDSVTSIPTNLIPEESLFHYHDPLAIGPNAPTTIGGLNTNYVNGIDTCTMSPENNCELPLGEYQFCIGETFADFSTAKNDPRIPPSPTCLLKSDFINEISPDDEWTNSINNRTPTERPGINNPRNRQINTYINRRVSFNDFGANNGLFITSLINYRSFFVSSTPNTDLVIHIRQAERTVYTQSINPAIDGSNIHIPIRLNLGTTSGTAEYVEAVQATLTSAEIYWKKDFYPPKFELKYLEFEFSAYDRTPIPLERTLGFLEQFQSQALLFSSSVNNSFIFHSSYTAFLPNKVPFPTSISLSPSSVILNRTTNSKTLDDPFDITLSRYSQRNFSMLMRIQAYERYGPGLTNIVQEIPAAYRNTNTTTNETFIDSDGNEVTYIPKASNTDNLFNES